jgi:hypothetical protein
MRDEGIFFILFLNIFLIFSYLKISYKIHSINKKSGFKSLSFSSIIFSHISGSIIATFPQANIILITTFANSTEFLKNITAKSHFLNQFF